MTALLTLNLANPPESRASALLEWLWHRPEDVLVLTELGPGRGCDLVEAVCRRAGHAVHVSDRTSLGVMVVGRDTPVRADPVPPPAVLPGRVCPVVVGTGESGIRLAGVYGAASDPVRYAGSAQRARKREWLGVFDSWVSTWLGGRPGAARDLAGDAALDDALDAPGGVVLGDLNLVDPLHDSALPYVLAEETQIYHALGDEHGLTDAFRRCRPDDLSPSWVDHSGVGCRYDHAFVTTVLVGALRDCALVPEPRLEGLTDHSALTLVLDL